MASHRRILSYDKGTSVMDEVDGKLQEDCEEMLCKLKALIHKTQQRMTRCANEKCRVIQFELNDWVYLKLKLYPQSSLGKFEHHKLAPWFIGLVAYQVALPPNSGFTLFSMCLCCARQ